MSSVQTYVFFDIETTGLPTEENNKTKITELSLVAVKREHLLDCGLVPRVQHKITLCVNPERMIQPESTRITGLDNFLLEHESSFNMDVFTILNTFLNRLNKPVCLVAHNGHMFDFPILKTQLLHLGVSLSQNVMCVDSLHCFYEIMEEMKTETTNGDVTKIDKNDICDHDPLQMQLVNETTPRKRRRIDNDASLKTFKSHKRTSWAKRGKLTDSYKLPDIYKRLLNKEVKDVHRAEGDCLLALECSVYLGEKFVKWVDENYCPFEDIPPMTVGVSLKRSLFS